MKKPLILLIWVLGLAVIAWFCLRGEGAATPGVVSTEPSSSTMATSTAGAMAPTTTGAMATASATAASGTGTESATGVAGSSRPAGAAPPAAAAFAAADAAAAKPSPGATAAAAKIEALLADRVVEFASSRAVLTEAGQATLAEIAAVLKDYPTLKFEVRGHTDSTGPANVNFAISQGRADAVKSVLVSLDIDADRGLVSHAFEESQRGLGDGPGGGAPQPGEVLEVVLLVVLQDVPDVRQVSVHQRT